MEKDFLPFARPTLDEDTIARVVATLRSGWLASGPRVLEFEAALSSLMGGRSVRSFTHATGALEVALQLIGVGPGDEVIVPAMTFAATANVVLRVGACPVFVDVDLDTRNIDLDQAEAAITPRTRAIMPVHFAGLPVDMDRLYAIAGAHGLRVVEDAAHAIGSAWKGRPIGSFGDMAAFSFHPNKNMTTIEGGALSIADNALLPRLERLRFHGITRDAEGNLDVLEAGGKYNLSDVAATLGVAQLGRLAEFNERRLELVRCYHRHWGVDDVTLPALGNEGHSWHMFAPLIPFERLGLTRKAFIERMREQGIGIGIHYPAMTTLSAFRSYATRPGGYPNAERIGRDTVTLPLFPTMSEVDVERVCATTRAVLMQGHR